MQVWSVPSATATPPPLAAEHAAAHLLAHGPGPESEPSRAHAPGSARARPPAPAIGGGHTPLGGMARPGAPGALAGLIDCIARDDFAVRALAELNRTLPLAWWTVARARVGQPPSLCLQASHRVPDIALDCWQIYRNGVYREDAPYAEACERVSGAARDAVLTRCGPEDFGTAHRERIYVAHSLAERISLVSADPDQVPAGSGKSDGNGNGNGNVKRNGDWRSGEVDGTNAGAAVLAINLYRHRAQARFDAAEIDTVLAIAGPLIALVRRHLQLMAPAAPAADPLRALCEALTPRELEVCDRLLRGLSFEGIAADLGLSATTVKTYRNRAFERLGIHHRNELFGLLWRQRHQSNRPLARALSPAREADPGDIGCPFPIDRPPTAVPPDSAPTNGRLASSLPPPIASSTTSAGAS